MAQFIALDKNVTVNGQTILSVVNAMEFGKEERLQLLLDLGINPKPDEWYSQQTWLDAFKIISKKIGNRTLFIIGKAIPENAIFPKNINNLKKALESIDVAYHLNHRGGEIGHYKLVSFDAKKKVASMICSTPYPSEFDRGIITAMLRGFKPKGSIYYNVVLDSKKQSRNDGGESCTYSITW